MGRVDGVVGMVEWWLVMMEREIGCGVDGSVRDVMMASRWSSDLGGALVAASVVGVGDVVDRDVVGDVGDSGVGRWVVGGGVGD